MPSPTHAARSRSRCRNASSMRRERLSVLGNEQVGPYALLRMQRCAVEPGIPCQFFMLEAPGRLLPRPMSLCLAPEEELAFLIDPIGPGTRALCAVRPGDTIYVLGPLGSGFRRVPKPLLVGGGIGVAPFPRCHRSPPSGGGGAPPGPPFPPRGWGAPPPPRLSPPRRGPRTTPRRATRRRLSGAVSTPKAASTPGTSRR